MRWYLGCVLCFLTAVVMNTSPEPAGSGTKQSDENPIADPMRSPTFGRTAKEFVPDCRVILFSEILDQVPSDDGRSRGTWFEKTEKEVLVNGKIWLSKDDQPPRVLERYKSQEHERNCAVIEESAEQFRRKMKTIPGTERCFVDGQEYGAEDSKSFFVEGYEETVYVSVSYGRILVTFAGLSASMPLHPVTPPSQAEQDEQRLDGAYQKLISTARPGTLVLVNKSQVTPHPMAKADALIAALKKIPSLAIPVAENPFGEMVYRPLTVDGFFFGPDIVQIFAEQARREGH